MDMLAIVTAADVAHSNDVEWNTKLATWIACRALSQAYEEFGPLAAASEEFDRQSMLLKAEYGPGWRGDSAAKALFEPTFARQQEEEAKIARDCYDPQTVAAIALALHPAPNLPAALAKLQMIKAEELFNYLPMPRDPFDIVYEEMARFKGEA